MDNPMTAMGVGDMNEVTARWRSPLTNLIKSDLGFSLICTKTVIVLSVVNVIAFSKAKMIAL
jgi:hypothetical protein